MKRKNRLAIILCMALCLALSGTALAGMENAKVASYAGEDTGITLRIWSLLGNSTTLKYISSLSENTAWAERARRLGYNIEWTSPSVGSEKEQFTLMLTSGNIPDIVMRAGDYYTGGSAAAIADGVFMDVTPYLEEYCPNLCSLFESNPNYKKECFSDDGVFLGFSGATGAWKDGKLVVANGYPSEGPVIRADMLETLGIDAPTTIDEWRTALTRIRDEINPKIVLNFNDNDFVFMGAYNIGNRFFQMDGTAYYGPYTETYREYLEEMHEWYEEGLIDLEYATRDTDAMDAMVNNGEVAASAFRNTTFLTTQKSLYNLDWVATVFPSNAEGEEAKWRTSRYLNTGVYTLFASHVADNPELLKACLRFMDYGYSEEGAYLMSCGIYGVDYTDVNENGRVKYIEKYTADGNAMYAQLKEVFRSNAGSYLKPDPTLFNPAYFLDGVEEVISRRTGNTEYVLPAITLTAEETAERGSIMTDINSYVDEMEDKFIMGIMSMDEFDAYIEKLETMKIERALEITQNALDRFIAR